MSIQPKSSLATAVVLGVIIFLMMGAPGISSNPVDSALNRCMNGKSRKLTQMQKMGFEVQALSKQIENSCGYIKSICNAAPEGFMCKNYLKMTEEQFFLD